MTRTVIKYLLAGLFLVLVWKLAWDYMDLHQDLHIRAVGDIWDLRTYYNNGKWFLNGTQPYVDVPSEYPQAATYLFGWIHWFSKDATRPGVGRDIYFHTFSLIMAGFTYLNFILVSTMLNSKKWLAFLLFLPGPIYYTLYRFDALPAFLCLLAIYLIRKRYWNLAAILLGIATLTKWYAILLVPLLAVHIWSVERKLPWKPLFVYLLTCMAIVTPTLMAGGMDALMSPYQFHSGRGIEAASLPGYLSTASNYLLPEKILIYLFLGLQVAASAISFFFISNSHEQFENWAAIILGCFVLFSRIFSPQWILWVLPLLILTSRSSLDYWLMVIYGVLVYAAFPIVYDMKSSYLPLVNLISLLPLFVLVARNIMNIEWKFAYSSIFHFMKTEKPQA